MAETWPVVLIHSDGEPVGQALRFVLRMEKVCAQLCPDAAALLEAPALLQAHCLVLRDAPPVDGCALLRAARERGARAPAILLVEVATPKLRARAAAAEIWLVLEKPVMDGRLLEAILSCVPRREAYAGEPGGGAR